MISSHVDVRAATVEDLERVNDIANQYIRETHYNFELEPMTMEARHAWFSHFADRGRYRLLVGLSGDLVIGFASSGRYRPKHGYDTSVETSVYLAPEVVGRGVGTKLYEALFKSLEHEDIHRAYAGIALPNPASVALHERFGFKRVAHFTEQGRKFDRYWDVAWYERPMGVEPEIPEAGGPEAQDHR